MHSVPASVPEAREGFLHPREQVGDMTLGARRRFTWELSSITDAVSGTPVMRLVRTAAPLQAPAEARSENGTFRYQFNVGRELIVSARRFPTADAAVAAGEAVRCGAQPWVQPETADAATSR